MTPRYAASRHWLQCAIGSCLLLSTAAAPFLTVSAQAAPAATDATMVQAAQPQRTVLVLGDSLSAAYGLAPAQGWVALLTRHIAEHEPDWRVVNASISGETTAGGAARIADALKRHRPEVVVIELGVNDGLRGLPLLQVRINLATMIGAAHGAGAQVLLIGMRLPPNYGRDYTEGFLRNYSALAERFDTALLPFLLQPIALDRTAFQADNLHPVAEAQHELRDHVWRVLEPMLQ